MKLISKFHDYYDTVLGHGRDEGIVYVRDRSSERVHISKDIVPWLAPLRHGATTGSRTLFVRDLANNSKSVPAWYVPSEQSDSNWRFDEAFVLVAGKPYPVWLGFDSEEVVLGQRQGGPVGDVDPQALVQAMTHRQAENRFMKDPRVEIIHHRADGDRVAAYDEVRQRFLAQDFTDLHLAMQAPVLLIANEDTLRGRRYIRSNETQTDEGLRSNACLVKNPRLADLGFARTLDPFTCFQNISQFISGVVPGQQMPMIEISDKAKIQKKGFDPKYGFRTRPASKP